MKGNKELTNIFDECLRRLYVGEPVEACLRSYPECSSELEPLLRTAFALRRASAIKPGEEFKARARYQLKSALAEAQTQKEPLFTAKLSRWALVLGIILVFLSAGTGTVAAAEGAMPDSPLYPVKLATEQVRLVLPASHLRKAEMNAQFVDKRVAEIIYMAKKGNVPQIAALTRRLDKRLMTLVAVAQTARAVGAGAPIVTPALPTIGGVRGKGKVAARNGQARLKRTIIAYAVKHPTALKEALAKAPEPVRADISRAINIAVAGYEKALKSLD